MIKVGFLKIQSFFRKRIMALSLRKRTHRIMYGYRRLKRDGQIDKIARIKQRLTELSLNINSRNSSKYIYGESGVSLSEIITRQYLLLRIGGINFNKALLYALGKKNGRVVFPMPRIWIEELEINGIYVNRLASTALWRFYLVGVFGYGVIQFIKISLSGITNNKRHFSKKCEENYVYFQDLARDNLPTESGGKRNIITWYLCWPGRAKEIRCVAHSVKNIEPIQFGNTIIKFQKGPIPDFDGLLVRLRFLLLGFFNASIAAVDLLRGRWWHALMLNQSAALWQVSLTKKELLAKEYFFHNSNWIYRPIWTYEAQSYGAAISFYFYSTNCENFKTDEKPALVSYGWGSMNWPRYMVWDRDQANFVKGAVKNKPEIIETGSIWFLDHKCDELVYPKIFIAVFDVQPVRRSLYESLALSFEYYIPTTSINFLSDIQAASHKLSISYMLKRKRKIGRLAHPKYQQFLLQLAREDGFIEVPPELNALEIIDRSVAVISMPFTSTALLANSAGKPSAYYDPTGQLIKNDPAAHGILILSGRLELERWLQEILNDLGTSGGGLD